MDRHGGALAIEIGLIVGALSLGTVLYGFRCRRPRAYGMLEILVGLSIATYVLDPFLSGLSLSAGVYFTALGALYVVVRGVSPYRVNPIRVSQASLRTGRDA